MQAQGILMPLKLCALLALVAATLLWPRPSPASATGANSITSPDTTGYVGSSYGSKTSVALDASGYPVVSYYDQTNNDLKVLHCNDANCDGGDESITSPDTGGDVGYHTSLALDASGNPAVSYYDFTNGDLKVLHCNDPNCSGGDESITSPDTGGDVGSYTSLALDASGYPVVSYYDETNDDLKVLRCGNANCSSGNSITSPDTVGAVGAFTSLAVDASGYPVVSYHHWNSGDLKVLHCNDPNCSGGGESITSPDTDGIVGPYTSLALDAGGYPVVSYWKLMPNIHVRVLHCNDANCSGGDESITSPDTVGTVGAFTSLALDGSGSPVVSYYDFTNDDLKVLHCNDANCAGGDESTASPDTAGDVGWDTSLALDSSGNPVVSYYDLTNGDLKVLHCGDPDCSDSKTNYRLAVPNFQQCDPPLPDTLYDSIDLYVSESERTDVCWWGCALTSAVDVLGYWGAKTTPGALNDWLKGHPRGYVGGGYLNWNAITEYAEERGIDLAPPKVYWDTDAAALRSSLDSGYPVILGVTYGGRNPGHWLVAVGPNADTWWINDPGGVGGATLDAYGNTFSRRVVYEPDSGSNARLILRAHSPMEFVLTDPQGRRLGFDPRTETSYSEIPGGSYGLDGTIAATGDGQSTIPGVKTAWLNAPTDGEYALEVIGTGTGTYSIDGEAYDQSGAHSAVSGPSGTTSPGQVDSAEFYYTSQPSPVGGIAELPEVAGAPLETPRSWRPNASLLVAVVAAVAGATILGGAGWYAGRRRVR